MSHSVRATRGALLSGAAILVMAMAAASATAQDATETEEASAEGDVIVITGLRNSLRSAQDIKRDSEVIVDAITAVDIGALPDRSVSEALQRISGITLQRTNEARDPARLAAEGGGVFIRGLSWVRSETNGRDIFSARNGRDLSFEDVSADLLAGVDVYKNPAANQIEGGIGGTVNLRTRRPFDQNERLIAFAADYNYGDMMEEGFWSGSGIFSDRWDTGIGEIGVLVNLSYSNVGNRTNSMTTDRFDERTDYNGDTVYIPKFLGWRDGRWEQERTAAAVALQWAPTPDLEFTFQAFHSQADPRNIERVGGMWDASIFCTNETYRYENSVFVGGEITGVDGNGNACWPAGSAVGDQGTQQGITYEGNTRYGEDHKTTQDYALNMVWTPNDRWSFSGDVQYVRSTAEILSFTVGTQRAMHANTPLIASVDLSGAFPSIVVNPRDQLANQDEYYWAFAMDHIEDNEAESLSWRGDGSYEFVNSDWLRSFSFGYRATDREFITRQSNWNWSILSAQYWGNANNDGSWHYPAVYLDDGSLDPSLPGYAELYSFDNFFRGSAIVPGSLWLPTEELVSQGTQFAHEILSAITTRPWPQGQGWGWSPASDDWDSYVPGGDNPNTGVTTQDEQTQAVYGLLRFEQDDMFPWPIDGNLGLRIVQTETSSVGTVQLPSLDSTCDPNTQDCDDFIEAAQFSVGGALDDVAYQNSYTNYLPSLNVRAHLRDDLQLRLAVSRAMVRPSFNQMQPFTELSVNFVDGANGPQLDLNSPFTGVGGNPELNPILATQFDASLEWYFAPEGSVTFAIFHKNIEDYIFSGTSEETYTNNGVTYTFDVTRQTNGDEGTVSGFEIAYQQFYDFLPGVLSGLGLQANYTYIDSDGGTNTASNIFDPTQRDGADLDLPLEGMSPTSYNIALLYEQYDISARLAWNWREQYLLTTSAANVNAPVWSEDYGQLDGSIFYSVTEDVSVGLQATNLTQERTILRVGHGDRMPRYNWVDTDRRIAAVLRARF